MALHNFSWVIPNLLAGSALPGGRTITGSLYRESDLWDLREEGVDVVVPLLSVDESFGREVEKTGMKWLYFPITDFDVPRDDEGFRILVQQVLSCMQNNQAVCAHCYAGIGRTGLLLACVVGTYFDMNAKEALDLLASKRKSFDAGPQIDFVRNFLAYKKE